MGATDKLKKKAADNQKLGSAIDKVRKVVKEKKGIVILLIAAVIIAIAVTVVINVNKGNYEVLFPGMSQEENSEIYAVLQSRDVDVKRNADGEVMVKSSKAGDIMLDMSALGYPKTTLPFDIFSDNTGFTTTEFEKKQYLLLNLQDRIERTLKDMSGVKNAIVTLNVPDDGTYVWEEEESSSTGSVSLTLTPGYELSSEKVSAIKNLIADSVPNLLPENVTVVNADTMQEFEADSSVSDELDGIERLDFESKVESRLTKKIENVLSLGYSPDQYRVSATVVIDYDKMITEDYKYVPEKDGKGIVEHSVESNSANGTGNAAGGVAGEENNTDVPDYTAENGDNNANSKNNDYYREMDYVISYIKKQIEKDNVKLEKATVAIAVNDSDLTEAKRNAIINSASKAANIAPEDIVVTGFNQSQKTSEPTQAVSGFLDRFKGINPWILIGAGVGILLVIILIAVLVHRSHKKKDAEEEQIFADESLDSTGILERAQSDAVENLIKSEQKRPKSPSEEVKAFAKTNPEITAAMISSWLKEDE
ncbi:flagellar M-ring protein FliF [Faecalicatena sp. AGMB00832]|uniref:Flagellar M-ring protein FliF n=1 Tax=Faecalicatena faecalis TaxID=2726362 RepID=A0ABS6D9L0_9FIRM|nr:flagellar basal-body MS-ring/collar protein FliF [Faecalicatena faecalis]MBU3878144.1 flagellar M-ring protein FliF [Faecalicatena faecalis]